MKNNISSFKKRIIAAVVMVSMLSAGYYFVSHRFRTDPYSMKTKDGVVYSAGLIKTDTWTGKTLIKMTVPKTENNDWVEVK